MSRLAPLSLFAILALLAACGANAPKVDPPAAPPSAAPPSAAPPSAAPAGQVTVDQLAGRWAMSDHDNVYLMDLVVTDGTLTGIVRHFTESDECRECPGASPNEFLLGRSTETSGTLVLNALTYDPATGRLSGDLGEARVIREGGAIRIEIDETNPRPMLVYSMSFVFRPHGDGLFIF